MFPHSFSTFNSIASLAGTKPETTPLASVLLQRWSLMFRIVRHTNVFCAGRPSGYMYLASQLTKVLGISQFQNEKWGNCAIYTFPCLVASPSCTQMPCTSSKYQRGIVEGACPNCVLGIDNCISTVL